MRNFAGTLFLLLLCTLGYSQPFEGILQIDYRNPSGSRNAVDVYVKGDKFFIKRVFGGCDRYDAYIYDVKAHTLICLSPQSPRTALSMDIDKVLDIFETKQLKPGFQIHTSYVYTPTDASRKVENILTTQKKYSTQDTVSEIWIADMVVDYSALIPVLRITGFWGDTEDGDNVILESKTTTKKNPKGSTINVTPVKYKVDDKLFLIPQDYQQIDLDKFLVNEYKSPRYGDLVKAFTGF
jgi:hypothetical protein